MNEKKKAWTEWVDEFRVQWSPPHKKEYAAVLLAQLFGFRNHRKVESISEASGNEKAVLEILAAIPTLGNTLEQVNKKHSWNLSESRVAEFRSILVPKLAKVCRELVGHTSNSDYRLLNRHFDDLRVWETKWKTVTNLTLVNITGGRFRNRRLDSQCLKRPSSFVKPTQVGVETDKQMERRINLELDGDEPWGPNLQRLTVFIASEEMFERWLRADGTGEFESPRATRMFWTRYLAKLLRVAAQQRRAGERRRSPLVVELFELNFIDFVAHCFDHDSPGGQIVGTHLLSGAAAPLGFEVDWPLGAQMPPHFQIFKKALEDMKTAATSIPLDRLEKPALSQ